MNTMGCNEFLNQLDAWLEGERQPDARSHVRDCARCRGVAGDLDAIHEAAPLLAVEDAESPERVWIAIRAQLEQEGLIAGPSRPAHQASPESSGGWFEGFFGLPRRAALAVVYMALLVAAAFALGSSGNHGFDENSWMKNTENSTLPLSAHLDSAEQAAVSSFSDSKSLVAASLHQNLAVVDNYISLCEKSVQEQPENELARDFLYQAYQQKADLLGQMAERGDPSQ
ncbi:MAG: hypothetical protein ACRD4C_00535 [Candidatus Acidiferrales bacterium]